MILTNPPYGERLGEVEALKPFYKEMGDVFKQRFKGWDAYVFSGASELVKQIGLKTSRKIPLYNGALDCRLLKYEMY
jgi:putative N6-adenine-specific DNA methylase